MYNCLGWISDHTKESTFSCWWFHVSSLLPATRRDTGFPQGSPEAVTAGTKQGKNNLTSW